MTIEEYHEACRIIDEKGQVELEIEDKKGNRKRMIASEHLRRLKQFGFPDRSISPVSYTKSYMLKE